MEQPDGARKLFRFRKRGAARGRNEFRIANFFSDAEETTKALDKWAEQLVLGQALVTATAGPSAAC
jgi:hypothetical protein